MKRLPISWPIIVVCVFAASALLSLYSPRCGVVEPTSSPAGTATKPDTNQPTTASMPTGGTIVGKLVREMTGTAVAGAKIELLDARRKTVATTKSDAKGFFVLENVPVGNGYNVTAFDGSQRAGAAGGKQGVSVKEGIQTDVGAITVSALPG